MSPPSRLADCLLDPASPEAATAFPLAPLRPAALPAFLEAHPGSGFLRSLGFAARAGELVVGPADGGLFAVLGLGEEFPRSSMAASPPRCPRRASGAWRHHNRSKNSTGNLPLSVSLWARIITKNS